MAKLCLLLGDQLNLSMESLQHIDKKTDMVLMAEVRAEATYVKHHKKKIAFIFSAMRHFANELESEGFNVRYIKYTDDNCTKSLFDAVLQTCDSYIIDEIYVCKPGEYRLFEDIKTWSEKLDMAVNICSDNRFIAKESFFSSWASNRKQLRMEYFYREMRKQTQYLMDNGKPSGDKWNFDSDNRAKLPKDMTPPPPTMFEPDTITEEVIALVESEFSDHFGDLLPFHYAVTRTQALTVLNEFIEQRLPNFGTYQDAMVQDEPWMYHSHISFYLNTGLLMPTEVLDAAQQAYIDGHAALNCVEGFIRQILGWREYVRGFYWHLMPGYNEENYLQAKHELPEFYWSGKTDMNCISQSVKQTKEHAYAHHIQRLMVLGNFALLAGIAPSELNRWYLIVYGDAYEWVELPNVSGMVLFADGGLLASKPYAASGAYIHKMSNYCNHCHYNVKAKTGEDACPFNYLYWGFLHKHKHLFENNPRMAMIYKTMGRMDQEKLRTSLDNADTFLDKLITKQSV
ncbi:MAG: cryptochrome/photolyase family protein [Glaciecola sp.]